MKRKIALLVGMAMIFSLVFTGTAFASSAESEEKSEAAAIEWGEDESYDLIFANSNTPQAGPSVGCQKAIDYIMEKSEGHITITPYYNTLVESADLLDGVMQGVADIVYMAPAMYPGSMPAIDLLNMNYVREMPDTLGLTEIAREAIDTIPELQEEATKLGFHIVDLTFSPNNFFACHGDDALKINKPEDIKGLVILATGVDGLVLDQVGASSISMAPSDWYSSFEKGLLNIQCMSWPMVTDFGFQDITGSYVLFGNNMGLNSASQEIAVNLDTWDSLPDYVQNLLTEGFRYGMEWLAEYNADNAKKNMEDEIAAGKVINQIPEEEMGPWYELNQFAISYWKDEATAAGLDAEGMRAKLDEIIDNYIASH